MHIISDLLFYPYYLIFLLILFFFYSKQNSKQTPCLFKKSSRLFVFLAIIFFTTIISNYLIRISSRRYLLSVLFFIIPLESYFIFSLLHNCGIYTRKKIFYLLFTFICIFSVYKAIHWTPKRYLHDINATIHHHIQKNNFYNACLYTDSKEIDLISYYLSSQGIVYSFDETIDFNDSVSVNNALNQVNSFNTQLFFSSHNLDPKRFKSFLGFYSYHNKKFSLLSNSEVSIDDNLFYTKDNVYNGFTDWKETFDPIFDKRITYPAFFCINNSYYSMVNKASFYSIYRKLFNDRLYWNINVPGMIGFFSTDYIIPSDDLKISLTCKCSRNSILSLYFITSSKGNVMSIPIFKHVSESSDSIISFLIPFSSVRKVINHSSNTRLGITLKNGCFDFYSFDISRSD